MKFQSTRQDKQEKMTLSETSLVLQVEVGQSMITNWEIRCHQGSSFTLTEAVLLLWDVYHETTM